MYSLKALCDDSSYTKKIRSFSRPKRPQDRINLPEIKSQFLSLLKKPTATGGYGKENEGKAPIIKVSDEEPQTLRAQDSGGIENNPPGAPRDVVEMVGNRPYTAVVADPGYASTRFGNATLTHGSVVIAAITSCTNTSNPAVMVAAGLLAKKSGRKRSDSITYC